MSIVWLCIIFHTLVIFNSHTKEMQCMHALWNYIIGHISSAESETSLGMAGHDSRYLLSDTRQPECCLCWLRTVGKDSTSSQQQKNTDITNVIMNTDQFTYQAIADCNSVH